MKVISSDHDFSTLKRTTVADMRKALDKLPDDAPLFIDGMEGGYHDAKLPDDNCKKRVCLNYYSDDSEWYYGPHESCSLVSNCSKDSCVTGYVIRGE